MAKFFDQLAPEHIAFIERQALFFVATCGDGAHPNLSPKGYDTLRVLGPDRLVYVDWPGSGNQTATQVAAHGRITLMFCSFERTPMILRLYGKGRVIHRKSAEFAALAACRTLVPEASQRRADPPNPCRPQALADRIGPHTRQLIAITVQRVQTSCGYAVPLFEYRGERDTLQRYYDKKHAEVDWETYLHEHTQPHAPIVRE